MTRDRMQSANKRAESAPECRIALETSRIEPCDIARLARARAAGASVLEALATEPHGRFAIGRVEVANDELTARGIAPGDRVAIHRADLRPTAGSLWRDEVDVPADAIHLVPAQWSRARAALLPELALALRALRAGAATTSDRVAVFGLGPAALCAVRMLKAKGIRTVVAVDADEASQRTALVLGADVALAPVAFEHLATANADQAADRAICFMPDNALLAHALRSTNHLGTLVVVSCMLSEPAVLPDYYREMIIKETTIVGAYRPAAKDWQEAVTILSTSVLDVLGDPTEIAMDAALETRLLQLTDVSLTHAQALIVFPK